MTNKYISLVSPGYLLYTIFHYFSTNAATAIPVLLLLLAEAVNSSILSSNIYYLIYCFSALISL